MQRRVFSEVMSHIHRWKKGGVGGVVALFFVKARAKVHWASATLMKTNNKVFFVFCPTAADIIFGGDVYLRGGTGGNRKD